MMSQNRSAVNSCNVKIPVQLIKALAILQDIEIERRCPDLKEVVQGLIRTGAKHRGVKGGEPSGTSNRLPESICHVVALGRSP